MPTAPTTTPHCATFSDPVLNKIADWLRRYVPVGNTVLDPFAGTGKVHFFAPEWDTKGVEIEPEWADMHNRTIQGDALDLPFSPGTIDAIVTSPCYGNRMADTYLGDAKGSKRYTYTTALGRLPTDGSAATMQWGPEYRAFHEQAWTEASRVLAPGGHFILNISDHIRAGVVQPVTTWHVATICHIGMKMLDIVPIRTRRQRHGANGSLRVDNEWLVLFAKDRMF